MSNFTITKTEKLPNSEIKLFVTFDSTYVESFEAKAIESLQKNIKIDGFREGKVPSKMIKERVGDHSIFEEAAMIAIDQSYMEIIQESKIMSITRPEISITKLAKGNPVEVTVLVATLPEFTLPDYIAISKTLEKKETDVVVEEKEIEESIDRLRHMALHKNHGSEMGDDHNHSDEELPKVDEEFIKAYGTFKDVAEFREKIKGSILHEKGVRDREKRRLEVMDAVIDKSEIDVPKVMIQNETERMLVSMKDNINNMGLSYPDYLKHINKTEESLRTELGPDAIKRSKIQLILNKIAAEQKIIPEKAQVDHEVNLIINEIKDADPERARSYVETMLINEKVWQILEGQESMKQ